MYQLYEVTFPPHYKPPPFHSRPRHLPTPRSWGCLSYLSRKFLFPLHPPCSAFFSESVPPPFYPQTFLPFRGKGNALRLVFTCFSDPPLWKLFFVALFFRNTFFFPFQVQSPPFFAELDPPQKPIFFSTLYLGPVSVFTDSLKFTFFHLSGSYTPFFLILKRLCSSLVKAVPPPCGTRPLLVSFRPQQPTSALTNLTNSAALRLPPPFLFFFLRRPCHWDAESAPTLGLAPLFPNQVFFVQFVLFCASFQRQDLSFLTPPCRPLLPFVFFRFWRLLALIFKSCFVHLLLSFFPAATLRPPPHCS